MAGDYPTFDEIVARSRVDVRKVLKTLDPTIFESLIAAIVEANSGRHFDLVKLLQQLEKEIFPDTANRENLLRWAGYDNIIPFIAAQSIGDAVFTGTAGTIIPQNRVFKDVNDNTYINASDETVSQAIISITSLIRSGSTVTAVTNSDHKLASNTEVIIAGAVETEYNGTVVIAVTAPDEFTYEISGTPATPATGTITATCTFAYLTLNSEDAGADKNLSPGAQLSFVTPLSGANEIGYVAFSGFSGGADAEEKSSILTRLKDKRANPVANFNVGAIRKQAFLISGVTRILVKRVTPAVGQVTILFVRDNDDSIIPSAAEVAEVKASIVEILPATSNESDVIVTAPTPVSTDYIFSTISPDTLSMQAAIRNQLAVFYRNEVTFETTIVEEKYISAIYNTIDTETGDRLLSFTLSNPSGDIVVTTDEIGTLGSITFS